MCVCVCVVHILWGSQGICLCLLSLFNSSPAEELRKKDFVWVLIKSSVIVLRLAIRLMGRIVGDEGRSRGNMCSYYQSAHISPSVSLGNEAHFVPWY